MGNLTANFSSREFECPDCGKANMSDTFISMLQSVRTLIRRPMTINSGYRCEARNKSVGGKKTSSHLKGYAADISAKTSGEKWEIVMAAGRTGFKRIGIGKSFIHLDNDHDKSKKHIWVY